MKINVPVEMSAEDVKALQLAGRLTAGITARAALQQEFYALVLAHIDDLRAELAALHGGKE